jgi:hypothetical protein
LRGWPSCERSPARCLLAGSLRPGTPPRCRAPPSRPSRAGGCLRGLRASGLVVT